LRQWGNPSNSFRQIVLDDPQNRPSSLGERIRQTFSRLASRFRSGYRTHYARGRVWAASSIIWLAAIGVGLAAVGFAILTEEVSHLFSTSAQRYPWLPFVLTPAAAAGLLWLTRRFFAGTEGSGIPQVIAEMSKPADPRWTPLLSLRIAVGKLVLGVSAVGAGFSFGREGPTVQIGAALMSAIGRFLPAAAQVQQRHLIVAGGAAGLAAAFNAPLAGIVFAIEELSRSIESRMSGIVITAIVLAGVVAQAWLGNKNYFGYVSAIGETQDILQTILVCALISGIAGGIFARMLLISATGWKGRLGTYRSNHPYRFAAACGLMIAMLGWASGGLTWCSGYEETRALLESKEALPWYFGPAKFIATVVSYLSGLPGGIFAPSLAIGAGLGQNLVPWLSQDALPTTVIVLCMVGFLAAVTQAPITSFIIVMEMVNGYSLITSMMATALLASALARTISKPLYSTLAAAITERQKAAMAATPPPPPLP